MTKLVIQPHGRLNDWVADEKGYFRELGLDYELNLAQPVRNAQSPEALTATAPLPDIKTGAFESYGEAKGRKGEGAGDVSCACHWTVNQAAKTGNGRMWGGAYSVCDAAIVVPPESKVAKPEDLADTEVAVGYHSGSHYSAIQALEIFLPRERIKLKLAGTAWSRVDSALARKVPSANVFGPQLYLLEQHGFRRVLSTTFMMAFMFPHDVDASAVESYIAGLVRAQADIDLQPERYKHYFLKDMPARFRALADVRRFGTGERVVAQPYTRSVFETTQAWMHERKLFDVGPEAGVSYAEAVCT
jgi:ABC-type nitrate/sulfonate/bicarbonate transport system substrate-binding protein